MMRPLWLDYQRPEPGRRRVGTGLLLAGLAISGVLLADYLAIAAQIDTVERQITRLQREAELVRRAEGGDGEAGQGAGAGVEGEGAAHHGRAQWDALFAALEGAADDSMTLLALTSGAKEIQISGEAKDMGAAMDYMKRLQKAPILANTHLTQFDLVQEHPQRPVRFSVAADWREVAP